MDVKLMIVSGGKESRTLEFHADELVVGRLRSCPLCIPSAEVSRQHCRLAVQDGYFTVEDLGSSNGTYLNGMKIKELMVVRPGDLLEVGPVKFRLEYELSEEARALLDSAAEEQPAEASAEPSPFEFSFAGDEGEAAPAEGEAAPAGGEDPGAQFAASFADHEYVEGEESHQYVEGAEEANHAVDGMEENSDTAIVNPEEPQPEVEVQVHGGDQEPIPFTIESEEQLEPGENFTLNIDETSSPPPPPPAKKSRSR